MSTKPQKAFAQISCPESRDTGSIARRAYAAPSLTVHAADELPLVTRLAPFAIKYMYMNDSFAQRRDRVVSQAFALSTVLKYRVMFDTLPRTFERADIVLVGGNDANRLASFIRVNLPLLRQVPTIALGHNLLPKRRAELLNLGYDDVINLKHSAIDEVRAKVLAIVERYRITQARWASEEERVRRASEVCELDGLFLSQKRILTALLGAQGHFCTHEVLSMAASREHADLSPAHLRVLIHRMRQNLKPGYTINNIRGEGYRLEKQ